MIGKLLAWILVFVATCLVLCPPAGLALVIYGSLAGRWMAILGGAVLLTLGWGSLATAGSLVATMREAVGAQTAQGLLVEELKRQTQARLDELRQKAGEAGGRTH
jgi:class 3 adenylate cyclase